MPFRGEITTVEPSRRILRCRVLSGVRQRRATLAADWERPVAATGGWQRGAKWNDTQAQANRCDCSRNAMM
jgi:hypothetical protein